MTVQRVTQDNLSYPVSVDDTTQLAALVAMPEGVEIYVSATSTYWTKIPVQRTTGDIAAQGGGFWSSQNYTRINPDGTVDFLSPDGGTKCTVQVLNGNVSSFLTCSNNAAGNGQAFVLGAGGSGAAAGIGGDIFLESGNNGAGGRRGSVILVIGSNANVGTVLHGGEPVAGQRIAALATGSVVSNTRMPANTGDLVVYIGESATVPTANPVNGGILYVQGGALKYRGTGGTVTTIAPA